VTAQALIWSEELDAPLAWREGRPITRRAYLGDVHALARRLPAGGPMLNLTSDRYRFAVGLGAAMLRGQGNLMPPNHTPDTVARLRALFPGAYGLADDDGPALALPMVRHPDPAAAPAEDGACPGLPMIDEGALAAQVLTSGSTGAPVPHAKHWGLLVRNTRAGAGRLAQQMGRPDLRGVTLVATVPAQHMYGFESTVLVALLGGAAFDAGRPFYPADIAAALTRAPRPRMLVTTPFHLRMLLDSGVALPAIDLTLCATAPLAPQLAARAEAALAAPLMEIYGCTEAGQVASRRSVRGAEWHTYDGLALSGDGADTIVEGGHVPQPTRLADVLEVVDPHHFRLLGRSNDLINIAGKRSSLGHLNFHLNSVDGVGDGAFWLPPDADEAGTVRPIAFVVVSPALAARGAQDAILAALRLRVDAAFLPRRIVVVPALPREPGTGKLPAGPFAAWAQRTLAAPASDRGGDTVHTLELPIAPDHPAFAGHFPGQPLLPGVALLAAVLEAVLDRPALAARLGSTPRIGAVKFLAPVRPGAHLSLQLDAGARGLRFEVREGDRVAAGGQFEATP
jgi:acyl-CoA synthetase (AMP-forming)/AMP-acid ligase II